MSRPATARQREAIGSHDRSMVVTAGAGTGKTYVLVEKYLNLVENEGLRPYEILAMTFTDKAAAEMKERVRETVERRIESDPASNFWNEVADEIIIAPIMTFHSFCSQILREFAIEANLDPGFLILDEKSAGAIRKEAYDQVLSTPGDRKTRDALVRLLTRIDSFNLQKMLSVIEENREWFSDLFSRAEEEDSTPLIRQWQEFVKTTRDTAITTFFAKPDTIRDVQDLLRYARRYEGEKDVAVSYLAEVSPYLIVMGQNSHPDELLMAVSGFLQVKVSGNAGNGKIWDLGDRSRMRTAKKRLTDNLKEIEPIFHLSIDEHSLLTTSTLSFFRDLAQVARAYLRILDQEKQKVSGIDFGDIISYTHRFLHQNQELVSRHIRPRIRYILVDEFQDTDPAQFEIVSAIIGDLNPDMKSLCIVGDPKQSIYLFRNADVTRFKEAQHRILSDCSGKAIHLDTSFRSCREVIGFVNHLFSRLFAGKEKAWEFGYEPIHPCEQRRECEGSVQILLPDPALGESGELTQKEAEAERVAAIIDEMVTGGEVLVTGEDGTMRKAGYGDVAILIERRTHLSRYLSALSARDIPCYVHGGAGFYSRQEIYDIFNLLSFLLRPFDDAALFGVLRSPYFSLPDTLLYAVCSGTPDTKGLTLFDRTIRYARELSPESGDRDTILLKRAGRILSGWRDHAGREPVVLLINRIIRDSGIYTIYATLPQGEQMIANLEKIIRISRKRSERGEFSLGDLVDELAESIREEEREGEAALDTLSRTSVNIMTVHASKGLEFPIVILPDMGDQPHGTPPPLLHGDIPGVAGVRIPNPLNDYEIEGTPVYLALRYIRKEKETAEKKRLFYVGATRARDHLVLCGSAPKTIPESIDEGTTRIDWVCSALWISPEMMKEGGTVMIDPGDGSKKIGIVIRVDQGNNPSWQKREEVECQNLPPHLLSSHGRRRQMCITRTCGDENKKRRVYGLSSILSAMNCEEGEEEEGERGKIPGAGTLDPKTTGTILHQVFAGEDPELVLSRHGISSPDAAFYCKSRYDTFRSHSLLAGVSELFHELSFNVSIRGYQIEGRMDLLCHTDTGWMVIDYKSGGWSHARIQLAVYLVAAEKLVGCPVSGYLYDIHSGRFTAPDPVNQDELEDLIEDAVRIVTR